MLQLSENYKIAIKASVEAGQAIMTIYDTDFNVTHKADESPITLADTSANAIINNYLERTNSPIISEENIETPFEVRKNWKRCWMVDPLDGTKEFVKRNGNFTVNIALIEDGTPVFGVIYHPVSKSLYFGDVKQLKSYKIELGSHQIQEQDYDNAIQLSPQSATLKTVLASHSHFSAASDLYVSDLKKQQPELEVWQIGSSYKFCLMAEGKAQLYIRFAPTMEWDTAAGDAICTALKMKVLEAQTETPLQYNKTNLKNPNFICRF